MTSLQVVMLCSVFARLASGAFYEIIMYGLPRISGEGFRDPVERSPEIGDGKEKGGFALSERPFELESLRKLGKS
jgi:hypothetical protein